MRVEVLVLSPEQREELDREREDIARQIGVLLYGGQGTPNITVVPNGGDITVSWHTRYAVS